MSPSASMRPVLVGIGVAAQREDDPRRGSSALALMIEAVRRAGADAGAPDVLRHVGLVAVPRGRWSFRDPARAIADAIDARSARRVLATLGVLQQTLIGEACAAIQRGEVRAAIVTGADCGHRRARLESSGLDTKDPDPTAGSEPDRTLNPESELLHPAELRAGLRMPIGLYAIHHSAMRFARGLSLDAQRDEIAHRYERFARVAADNPHAWSRTPHPAASIREPGPGNAMIAFPYNRLHCANWSVDQGAALLLCSEALADEVGIPPQRRIHPRSSATSDHMVACCERTDLHRFPAITIAGRRALDDAAIDASALDLIDLYTSFPVAAEAAAAALALRDDVEWTVTGGMSFAGGPFNNYLLQATARLAGMLRAGRGRHGLVHGVSGVMTKHSFGVWSREPAPAGFACADVSDEVARASARRPVATVFEGAGTIAGYTVLGERSGAARAVAFIDTADGRRAVATNSDTARIEAMQRDEHVGCEVVVAADGRFAVRDDRPT